jgi:hypothetical protein
MFGLIKIALIILGATFMNTFVFAQAPELTQKLRADLKICEKYLVSELKYHLAERESWLQTISPGGGKAYRPESDRVKARQEIETLKNFLKQDPLDYLLAKPFSFQVLANPQSSKEWWDSVKRGAWLNDNEVKMRSIRDKVGPPNSSVEQYGSRSPVFFEYWTYATSGVTACVSRVLQKKDVSAYKGPDLMLGPELASYTYR